MKRSTFGLVVITVAIVAFFRMRSMTQLPFRLNQGTLAPESSKPRHEIYTGFPQQVAPIDLSSIRPAQKSATDVRSGKEPARDRKEPVRTSAGSNSALVPRIEATGKTKLVALSGKPKGLALRRRGDSALNYMKRKDALVKQGFNVQLVVFSSWSLCNMNLEARQGKFADMLLCLSKSYCLNDQLYSVAQTRGILTDRILGQREFWSNKRGLCNTLRGNLKAKTPEGRMWLNRFSFECFVLPDHTAHLAAVVNEPMQSRTGWVFKPDNSGGGSGIFVKDGREAMMKFFQRNPKVKRTYVVQRKLSEPYLIHGKKFDLRTHVLVTSVAPMRAYVHKNGLVRFAGTSYADASDNNRTSFLTNLSVNNKGKNHEELSWTFHELRNHLGDEAALVFRRIDKAIAQLLVSTEKSFLRRYEKDTLSNGFKCSNCYQQIGVDILLDKDLMPHIMEVNGNPMQNFKSDKISAVCVKFQNDIGQLLYGRTNSTNAIVTRLQTLLRELSPSEDIEHWNWLDNNNVEYLLRMLAEHENNEGFRVIYPPSGAVVSKAEQVEWTELLRHLGSDTQRLELHNLLLAYQKQRFARCRDYHEACSVEVDDNLYESPYTVFKATFPS